MSAACDGRLSSASLTLVVSAAALSHKSGDKEKGSMSILGLDPRTCVWPKVDRIKLGVCPSRLAVDPRKLPLRAPF